MNRRFAHLVLKPTLACTARCSTCSTRKTLHRVKAHETQLGLDDWKKLFAEAQTLGLSKLTLSGGEPTLYKDLLPLIEEGKGYGWEIGLNTNGSLIDREYAARLKKAGVNAVSLSLYSAQPEFHDRLRQHPGLWQKAINAIQEFVRLREEYDAGFRVNLQTLLCKDNFRRFPDLIRLAYQLRVCGITFSYLEGDFQDRHYLLDESQIQEFKEQVIPAAIDVIEKHSPEAWTKKMAISALRSIYPVGRISIADYAKGIYRQPSACEIPSFFSIILADGDVHPCNMVEYTHDPVVGNLQEKSFREIWQGKSWEQFRREGFDYCRYCPVPQQVFIPIMRKPELAPFQYLIKYTALKALYLPIKRFVFSRRRILQFIRNEEDSHERCERYSLAQFPHCRLRQIRHYISILLSENASGSIYV